MLALIRTVNSLVGQHLYSFVNLLPSAYVLAHLSVHRLVLLMQFALAHVIISLFVDALLMHALIQVSRVIYPPHYCAH